jgi:uncharacterized protein YjbI with pentapeptide repeats
MTPEPKSDRFESPTAHSQDAPSNSSTEPKTEPNASVTVENGSTSQVSDPHSNGSPEKGADSVGKDGAIAAPTTQNIPEQASPQPVPPTVTDSPSATTSILSLTILLAIAIMLSGFVTGFTWLGFAGSIVAMIASLRVVWLYLGPALMELFRGRLRSLVIGLLGFVVSLVGLLQVSGANQSIGIWLQRLNWDAIGALGDFFGAFGQIFIAILAVYIAWRQYVISKDLTIQQNLITQQQTIDSYFQGISELVLDAEGLLEDWPQERAIAEGRTAAILSSVDAAGKAKIIRFLSRSRLLSPLRRDRHLGRAMLDGMGGYQEDRDYGIRVIDLGVMLAAANMSGTDLRWTDLSDANLVRANLSYCDLVKANLARTILYNATLQKADLMGARLFYGALETACPRTRADIPDYTTGAFTGAVVENADLTGVQRMSTDQRYYCCAWGGSKTRATVPGGCDGIPNRLGR